MRTHKYWVLDLGLGLVLLALAGSVMGAFPETGHDVLPGYGGPVFAFEMAKTQADLIAVFGPVDDPLRAARIAQMDIGNLWDFPFMLSYSLFMAMFCFAIWKDTKQRIWLAFIGLALLSGFADAIENLILLGVTRNMHTAPNLTWLGIPVWTKFLAIMACNCASSVYIALQKTPLWRAIGVAGFVGGLTIFAAFLSPSEYGYLIRNGTTMGWLAMLIFAGYRSYVFGKDYKLKRSQK